MSQPTEPNCPQQSAPARPRRLSRLLGIPLIVVILAFVARAAFSDWDALAAYPWRIEPLSLAGAMAGAMTGFCLWPVGVRLVLRTFGRGVPMSACWRAFCLSQFAKYLPGGIWAFVARAVLYRRHGIPHAVGGFMTVVEMVAIVAASQVVFVAGLPWFPRLGQSNAVWLCLLALPALCLALHPRLVSWAYNWLHRRNGQTVSALSLRYRDMLGLVGFYCVVFVVFGLSFCLLATALAGLPVGRWHTVVGMFPGAYGLAFLVVVAPSGIGVREGVLTGFLCLVFPVPVAAALALAARAWWFTADLLFSGTSLGVLALVSPDPLLGPSAAPGELPDVASPSPPSHSA